MKKYALCFALCFALTACLGGRSADPQFYTLTPQVSKAYSQKELTIGVNRVQVPRYLDRPQIISQTPKSNQITMAEDHRWIEPLPDLIARALVQDLETLFPNASIKTRSAGQNQFDYTITLEIVSLDTTFLNDTKLDVWWSLQDKSGQTLHHKQFTSKTLTGVGYQSLAKSQSALLAKLAEHIAPYLVK